MFGDQGGKSAGLVLVASFGPDLARLEGSGGVGDPSLACRRGNDRGGGVGGV